MAQKKIDIYANFQPTSIDNTGAQSMAALAGLAESVGDVAFQIGKQKRTEEGAAAGTLAGQEAVETGELESQNNFSFYGQSFNNSANAAYSAGLTSHIKRSIDESALEHPNDSQAFQQTVNARLSGITNNLPEETRIAADFVIEQALKDVALSVKKTELDEILINQKAAFVTAEEDVQDIILQRARAGDLEGLEQTLLAYDVMREGGLENGLLDPIASAKARTTLIDNIAIQKQLGAIDQAFGDGTTTSKIDKGYAILEGLKEPKSDISPEQQAGIVRYLTTTLAGLETDLASERAKISVEDATDYSDLQIAISRGGNPVELEQQVEKRYQSQILGDPDNAEKYAGQRTTLLKNIFSVSETEIKKQNGMNNVANVIAGVAGTTSINQSETDNYYNSIVQPTLPEFGPERSRLQTQYVGQTYTIPKQLQLDIRQSLVSGDVDRIAYASDLLDRVAKLPGIGDKIASKQQVAFASQVSILSEYLPADKAIANAKDATDVDSQDFILNRRKIITEEKFEEDYIDYLNNEFGGFIFNADLENTNPIQSAHLLKDFTALTNSYFEHGMEINDAKDAAMKQVSANWTQGQFGLMQYAPEQYYTTTRYIRENLYNDISETMTNQGISFTPDDIILISDNFTARRASEGRPDYLVWVRSDKGELVQAVLPNGETRFTPDSKPLKGFSLGNEIDQYPDDDRARKDNKANATTLINNSLPEIREKRFFNYVDLLEANR